jgi:GNAT superfamily N-acetyltransferase
VPFATPFVPVVVRLRDGREATIRACEVDDARRWVAHHGQRLREHASADAEWDWVAFVEEGQARQGRLCLALDLAGAVEGFIDVATSYAAAEWSRVSPGKAMVYVEHLAVAPENRPAPMGARRVPGVGNILVMTARALARNLGYDGRVGLHSAPEAEDFYRRVGFTELTRERCIDGEWLYFEIAGEQ